MFSNSSNDYYIKNDSNPINFVKLNEEETNNNNNYVNNSFQSKNKCSPFPTKCCVCGYICSGYVYYNVVCCDGFQNVLPIACNTKARFHSFFVRTARLYKFIPQHMRNSTPDHFSRLLVTFDISQFIDSLPNHLKRHFYNF
uniref:Uncharacterized protein n=1 Tax=Meloidogyne enterolobii TaxID=390850 RepID=A0A6V7U5K1_MELEN|nr:unnamed protein product [Meloidogyne enterolobii]